LLRISSDNSGADTKLTLTSGTISSVLQGFGIQLGDSIVLKWTVRAYRELGDSIQAISANNIKLVRYKEPTGSVNAQFVNGFSLYPNPANEYLFVKSATSEIVNYTISDVSGRIVMNGKVGPEEALNIQSLNKGIYFFRTENGSVRFLKN
jgi:hypothetical protein